MHLSTRLWHAAGGGQQPQNQGVPGGGDPAAAYLVIVRTTAWSRLDCDIWVPLNCGDVPVHADTCVLVASLPLPAR